MDSYSRPLDYPVGFPVGLTGKSWDWCRRMVARHRVLAVLTGTVVLFGCGMLTAATGHPPVRLTSADFAIAAVTYAAFAAIAVARWPSWLLVAAGTAGAVVSMAAGTHPNLIGSVLLMAMLVISLASDLPRVTVVGEAATGRQAIRLAKQERADVVLMDIRMPELDGLAATRQITADESLAGVKILILTTFEVDEYVFEALRAGASGFLGKGARPDALIEAIRTVARGDSLLSPAATRGLIARYLALDDRAPQAPPGLVDALTEREREIVALVATGMSNAEIADHLTLSPLTVKTHANHAMTKLGARDRAQLVVLAYQAGLAGRR